MKILATSNISRGFAAWVKLSDSMTAELEKVGVKLIWAGTNPDESQRVRDLSKCRLTLQKG